MLGAWSHLLVDTGHFPSISSLLCQHMIANEATYMTQQWGCQCVEWTDVTSPPPLLTKFTYGTDSGPVEGWDGWLLEVIARGPTSPSLLTLPSHPPFSHPKSHPISTYLLTPPSSSLSSLPSHSPSPLPPHLSLSPSPLPPHLSLSPHPSPLTLSLTPHTHSSVRPPPAAG